MSSRINLLALIDMVHLSDNSKILQDSRLNYLALYYRHNLQYQLFFRGLNFG